MKKTLATALLSISVIASGVAIAGEFADNAQVAIYHPSSNALFGNFTLLKQPGAGALGDGIYVIKSSNGRYLSAASGNAGEKVNAGDVQTKWVLHENSTGWSIMAADNEANAVTELGHRVMELQRNEGAPNQVWAIKQ